jgi:hypothetical protein
VTRYYSTHPGPLPLEGGFALAIGERTPEGYKLTGSDLGHLEANRLVVDEEPVKAPAKRAAKEGESNG